MPVGVYQRKLRGSRVNCEICGAEFYRPPSSSARFCSRPCVAESRRGQPQPWVVSHPQKRGPDSPNWKGDGVSYSGLHHWVKQMLGPPDHCAHCGGQEGKFQWANISGEYRRDLADWMPLCISCHSKYDAPRRPPRVRRPDFDEVCAKGHDLRQVGVYLTKDGRRCKACQSESSRLYHQRKRAAA